MSERRTIIFKYANVLYGKVQVKVELFADYLVEDSKQTLTRVFEEYQTSAALQTHNIKTNLLLSHAFSLCTFPQLCSVGNDNAQKGHSDAGQ